MKKLLTVLTLLTAMEAQASEYLVDDKYPKLLKSRSILSSPYLRPIFNPEKAEIVIYKRDNQLSYGFLDEGELIVYDDYYQTTRTETFNSSENIEILIYANYTHRKQKAVLSQYLKHFKQYLVVKDEIEIASEEYTVPSKVLSTLLFNESKFNNNAKSWTGVRGIAMITKSTQKHYGISVDTTQNAILGMAKILRHHYNNLPDYYTDEDKWRLAALFYNSGKGAYWAAKRYYSKKGLNPNVSNVKSKYRYEGRKYLDKFEKFKRMF